MRKPANRTRLASLLFVLLALFPAGALASPVLCPRPAESSEIQQPPELYSQNGVLNVKLHYYTIVDQWGRNLYCYETPDGKEGPILHLNPGDTLKITLSNWEPGTVTLGQDLEQVLAPSVACNDLNMEHESANMHFHGMNISPNCHGDDVIHTIVNPGQIFSYNIKIPKNEPPGMYWYHAHVHGISSKNVQGGASGAIEIEGIANYQPAVAGLPQRFLIVRDQPLQNPPKNITQFGGQVPFWDVSLNYVPVSYPKYKPGVLKMKADAKEFWRVVNAAADTQMDLEVLYNGKPQPLQIVALDGVPVGSQDGRHQGYIVTQTHVYIPVAGRAEFIVKGPPKNVKTAVFFEKHIDTGPAGDVDTARPLANIQVTNDPRDIPKPVLPVAGLVGSADRFGGLDDSMVTAHRTLYFDERVGADKSEKNDPSGNNDPSGGNVFFITVVGENERYYEPDEPPAIITHVGAVEDWTIQNRTGEIHEFHIHQIHFQLLKINGIPVPPKQRQWYDTYQVGYWNHVGPPSSITVRMDFRPEDIAGEFVYHCHILDHEDAGMMANIMVLPATKQARAGLSHQARRAGTGATHA